MKNLSKPMFLLLAGIAAGAIAGLLLAPEEGEKTRRKWLKKPEKIKNTVGEAASEYKDKLTGVKNDVVDKAADLSNNFN